MKTPLSDGRGSIGDRVATQLESGRDSRLSRPREQAESSPTHLPCNTADSAFLPYGKPDFCGGPGDPPMSGRTETRKLQFDASVRPALRGIHPHLFVP